jgi:hypothetical protein
MWEMWDHCNRLLHGARDRIHITSMLDIDSDISTEWEHGLDNLLLRYAHLFADSLTNSLQLQSHDKQR